MHNCAFCKNPLSRWSEWKASDGRFYCNEFCADASEATSELGHWPVDMPERRFNLPAFGAMRVSH